jgi:triosephosphate isomerase
MARAPRPLVAGNWKMNGLADDGIARARSVAEFVTAAGGALACDVAIAPPATLIREIAGVLAGTPVLLGGQDCHAQASGAHTGDVSAEMLKDAGCGFVIVGHSERRADHGETDPQVRGKADAAHRMGLVAIVCVGETEAERDADRAVEIVGRQLAGSLPDAAAPGNTVIAYEPVWAIGTGRTPTEADIAEMHGMIHETLATRFGEAARFRALYGGSVKPDNARAILAIDGVDGALVGGASLDAAAFRAICEAYG